MTPRPGLFKSKERPSSAIYIGSNIPILSPPNLPDLPEPPSPVASVSSRGSGLPSPPATNSTGSGSTGGDNDNDPNNSIGGTASSSTRHFRFSMNMLNESNVKTFQDALASSAQDTRQYRDAYNDDDDDDDEHNEAENEEDNTARLDRLLALKSTNEDDNALQRVKSLTERNRMTLNKITAFSRLSSPSPVPSRHRSPAPAPAQSASSSSSSSHTASSRQSLARSTARPRNSDSSLLHMRSQSYAFDMAPEHLSGSETERESTRGSQAASSHSHSQSYSPSPYQTTNDPTSSSIPSTSSSQARPQTPPPSQRRRLTSAPASPARARELSSTSHTVGPSRTRTPRKRASMAMTLPDDYDDYTDARYDRERDGSLRGSRANSRVGFVDLAPVDDPGQRDDVRAPSRTGSTFARRASRQPLPREFRDYSYEDGREHEVRAGGMSRQQSIDGSTGGDSGVDLSSNGRPASRVSGQLPPEPPTPHRTSHYASRQVQQSPRKSGNWSNTARDLSRRHQSRWLSGEVTFADTPHDRQDGGAQLGRRQSLRGGSAESALGLGQGRSLVGEGLRAAGLTKDTPPQRQAARESRDLDGAADRGGDRRPLSRLSGDTGPSRYSDSFRPSSRANGHIASEFRTPEHPSVHDAARKVATAPRAATSMALYRASLDGNTVRRGDDDDEDEPRTAPLLRTYRSSLGLETSTRVASALANRPLPERERYSSPYGGTRKREDGHTAGASSREQQAKHAELMKHSLDVFATNIERLGILGDGGRGGGSAASELVKSAEDIVSAAERLNEMIKSGTNVALTEQIDAELSGSSGEVDLVEVWRNVGGQWRDGLRLSDELVRSVTGFLLGIGRVVKDLGLAGNSGGMVGGYPSGHGGDGAHGRSISLDEDALARTSVASPEVATASSSSASGRRSVGSRRSWEPTPRDREREREETLKKLAGGDGSTRDIPMPRPLSELRNARTQRDSPLPQRRSVMNVFTAERRDPTSTPQRGLGVAPERFAPAMVPSSSMRRISNPQLDEGVVNSTSLETIHGYEPSPTPASRTQTATERMQPLTHRALTLNALNALNGTPDRERNNRAGLPPLSIPPPLAALASESLLQRNKTIAIEKPSARIERERNERRHKQAAASTSTIRPQFTVISSTNPTTALTTVTASPESQLFPLSRTDSERSGKSSSARSNAAGTFSRASTVSVSTALSGLRDRDQRQRTLSNTPADEPNGSTATAGPSPSAVKAVARAYGPMTPLSGSETERDTRRKTIGTRQGARPSLDGDSVGPGARSGQSTIMAPPTLPARTGRPRRQTVTALFDDS